jgi:beta-lactamase regulating signal transducer with metallopeptidase domain
VRVDRATRSFLSLLVVALSIGAFVLCGALGGVLMPLLFSDFARNGIGALAKVSMLPILMLVAWVFAGLMLGAWSFARQLVSSHRLARYVSASTVEAPNTLLRAAARGGQDVRLVLVDAPESFSFVYGMLTPRVAVSRGLIEAVSADELSAVIEHERYHVRNLDPLKIVLVRSLSTALFFLPALAALRTRYIADCELAADRQAAARCGDRSLAGALLKAIRGPSLNELSVAASIGGPDLLDARLVQLETGVEPSPTAIGHSRVVLSILSATLFTFAYLASAYSLGGPAAVYRVTGEGIASATMLGGVLCAAPLAVVGTLLYTLVTRRARQRAA